MAKQLNKTVVGGITAVLFVVIVGASVLMINQLKQQDPAHFEELAKSYLAKAKATDDKDQLRRAIIYYNRAWQASVDKKAPEPRYLVDLGNVQLDIGNYDKAQRAWRKAITEAPDLIEAHESRVRLQLEIAKMTNSVISWTQVESSAAELLKVDNGSAFAHNAYGLALVALRTQNEENLEAGLDELRQAIDLAPEVVDYGIDLANVYIDQARRARLLNEPDSVVRGWVTNVEDLMQTLLERFKSPGLAATKVRSHYGTIIADKAYTAYMGKEFDIHNAEQMHLQAIKMADDQTEAKVVANLGYAVHLLRRWEQNVNKARDREAYEDDFKVIVNLLDEAIELKPDEFEAYKQLARGLFNNRQYDKAIECCQKRLNRELDRTSLKAIEHRREAFYLMLIASQSALAKADASDDMKIRNEYFDKAEQFVADALGEFAEHPEALVQQGKIKWLRGEDREALELYRKADARFPRINWNTKITLAKLHLELNEPGAAKKVLEDVLDAAESGMSRNPEFWTVYAQALFQVNEKERARRMVEIALQIDPKYELAIEIRAAIMTSMGLAAGGVEDIGGERGEFLRLILRAEEQRMADDVNGAITSMQAALEVQPDNEAVLRQLVTWLLAEDRPEDAQAAVQKAIDYSPNKRALQRLMLATRQDLTPEERDRELLASIEEEPDPFIRLQGLGEYHYGRDELQQALENFQQAEQYLSDENKTSEAAQKAGKAGHRRLIARIMLVAARLDDQEALKKAVESAEFNNIDGAKGKSFLGQYHMYREEAELAADAFEDALELQPTDSRIHSYLGRCLQILGRTEEAIREFTAALTTNPNAPLAHKGLAQIYRATGQQALYEQHLARCEELLPRDQWVVEQVRQRAEEEDPEDAIQKREAQLASKPDDKQNIERLSYLYAKIDNWDKAEEYQRRLLELAPDDKNVVLATSAFYQEMGEPDKGLKVLQDYSASRPTPEERANARIYEAAHYFKYGQYEEMERALLQAAAISETFEVCRSLGDFYLRVNNPQRALEWLDKAVARAMLEKSPRLPETLSARVACLLHRNMNDNATAEQRVQEFRRQFPNDPRGLYWEAEIAARKGDLEVAIEKLGDYLDKRPNHPSALFQRSRYYVALGKFNQAIADLETLRDNQPAALEFKPRVALARLYAQTGRTELAYAELENVVENYPDAEGPMAELIDLYMRDKQYTNAERLITAQINRKKDNPQPVWYLLRAHVASELGEFERALADYREVVVQANYAPKTIVDLLSEYKNSNRCDAGLRWVRDNQEKFTDLRDPGTLSKTATLLACIGQDRDAVTRFRMAMDAAVKNGGGMTIPVYTDLWTSYPADRAVQLFTSQQPRPELVRANDRLLAGLYLKTGNTDRVGELLDGLLSTAGSNAERAELYSQKGEMFQLAKSNNKALEAYESALEYNQNDIIALNNLAFLLSDKMGEHATALAYAERAAHSYANANVLDTYGWIFVQLGQCQEAIAQLSRAVTMEDVPPITWYHLAEAYRQCGQFTDAGNVIKRAVELAKTGDDQELLKKSKECRKRIHESDNKP